ncbi:MAG: sigma-54 dependent transcriptional regulator [Rhodospirillaceae bacterium]
MRLLIIGSLGGQIGVASQIAMRRGAKVSQADDVTGAMALLRAGQGADLVMMDATLDVQKMIDALVAERFSMPVIACGVGTDSRMAVAAIRAGAKEFVPLPPDPELIAAVLEAVAYQDCAIIFGDPSMHKVMKMADQVAPAEASILIVGESGTGKELMARHIHNRSRRAGNTFIAVNCAAIPENLLESELFGHEKGSFTGAVARRIGKFEEAAGGTLLLDEVSEMDVRLQAKLLRVLQEREVTRVGGNQPVKINVRILATSNRNLTEEVRKGTFREDLLFRLNVVTLTLPPLRERPADIETLATHFAHKYADLNGAPDRPISPETMALLKRHRWRGNVRELENTIHRAVLLAGGDTIEPDAILLPDAEPGEGGSGTDDAGARGNDATTGGLVGRTVADVERDLIIDTLRHTLGNRTHAATILGISIRTLRNKLKLYSDQGLPVPPPGDAESAP